MRTTCATIALVMIFSALPADAQRAGRVQRTAPESDSPLVSRIIDARRQLNLTSRQLTQLDSMERAHYTNSRRLADQVMARRDSICANRRPCELSASERAAFADWVQGRRPTRTQRLRDDSVTRVRVMGVLDSTQREMVRARMEQMGARGALGDGVRARGERAQRGAQMGPARPGRASGHPGMAPQAPRRPGAFGFRGDIGPGRAQWGPPGPGLRRDWAPRDSWGQFDRRGRWIPFDDRDGRARRGPPGDEGDGAPPREEGRPPRDSGGPSGHM